ncbi:substrate-binding domain-containing protein, partial [Verrucomicrobiota bacterium]
MGYIGNSYANPVWRGACDAAEDLDANLICFTTNATDLRVTTGADSDPILDLLETLAPASLNGLVFAPTAYTFIGTEPGILQAICDSCASVPRISIGTSPVPMPSVKTDAGDGTRQILKHLIENHGYRRIALIPGDKFVEMDARRLDVYREVMAENDIPIDEKLIGEGCESSGAARNRVHDLIERHVDIDAIVLPGDARARGAIEALLSAGVSVPEQIAVVGCNDQPDSWQRPYSLTTIRLPLYELGYKAVESILANIEKGTEITDTVIPSELVIRHSCGCPEPPPETVAVEAAMRNVPLVENPDIQSDPSILRIAEDIATASHIPTDQVLGAAGALEESFLNDLSGTDNTFVPQLQKLLLNAAEFGSDTGVWRRLVLSLFHRIVGNLEPDESARAGEIIQHSRAVLTRATQFGARSRITRGTPNVLWHRTVSFLSNLLAGSQRSSSHAAKLLSSCGIERFCAGHWGPASESPRTFKLLMNWDGDPDERCWDPIAWEPAELFTNHVFTGDKRYTMLAMHAFFSEPNGVLIFQKSVGVGYVYEWLRMAFNAAIRMLLTIEKIGDQASLLAIANAQLTAEVEERKQAADSLTREQNLINTLIAHIPDHVYVKDRKGRFMLVNPAVAAKLGTSIENVIGKTDYDFQSKEMADAYRAQEADLFQSGEPVINFEEIPDPMRGISGWKLVTKVPFRDAEGNVAGLVGINHDITEIRAAEQALRNKEEELRQAQKMDAIGRLSGGIAHDFNNILTVVFGYSEAALMKTKAGESNVKELEAIMRAAEQAKEFTGHLLAFSRKQFLSLTAVDLNSIVVSMREMLAGMIGEDIELDIQLTPELFNV